MSTINRDGRTPNGYASQRREESGQSATAGQTTPTIGGATASTTSAPLGFTGLGGGGLLGTGGGKAMAPLGRPEETDGFRALSPALQAQVKELSGKASQADRPLLAMMMNNPTFRGMSAADQQKTLDVWRTADPSGRFDLNWLAGRSVDGHPALLDKDSTGKTTLDQLHKLATGPLDPAFDKNKVSRQELLASTMKEVGQPGEINQHSKGTCTVTAASYALSERNPAEYARLVTGLVSPEGSVRLKNGDTLKRNETGIAPDTATQRSASERVLQSSLMDYGVGNLYKYDNVSDTNKGNAGVLQRSAVNWSRVLGQGDLRQSDRGLSDAGVKKVYDGLFGGESRIVSIADGDKPLSALAAARPNHALLDFKWGDAAHEVTFDRIEGDRIYFRNPWGGRFLPPGQSLDGPPPRRLENPFTGLESMSLADAQKYLQAVVRD